MTTLLQYACCFVYCTRSPPSALRIAPSISCPECLAVTYCSQQCCSADARIHTRDCFPLGICRPLAFAGYQALQFQHAYSLELHRIVLSVLGFTNIPLSSQDKSAFAAHAVGSCIKIVLTQAIPSLGLAPYNDLVPRTAEVHPINDVLAVIASINTRHKHADGSLVEAFNLIRSLPCDADSITCVFVVEDAEGPVGVHVDTYSADEVSGFQDFGLLFPAGESISFDWAWAVLRRRVRVKARLCAPTSKDRILASALSAAFKYILLLSCMSPLDIAHYELVSRSSMHAVRKYKEHAYDLEKFFQPFFDSDTYRRIRMMQELTDTVISGSAVVAFMGRLPLYPHADLDFYTPHRFFMQFGNCLIESGYAFQPRQGQPKSFQYCDQWTAHSRLPRRPVLLPAADGDVYPVRGILQVFDFKGGPTDRRVQLVVVRNAPMEAILNFHSSCIMNVITSRNAISMFPITTFHCMQSILTHVNSAANADARQKWIARGWKMVSRSVVLTGRAAAHSVFRRVGDRHSWMVPIPLSGTLSVMSAEPHRTDPFVLNSWTNSADGDVLSLSYQLIVAWGLRGGLLVGDAKLWDALIKPFLRHFHPLAWPTDRSARLGEIMRGLAEASVGVHFAEHIVSCLLLTLL
ncbi:hypothetical protein HGRIS_011703 [Hohenbuehelia grisea]|uniref:MYND-type domain-containing protein n=1 Tax=Hohenbuehelia grisea TaxID=104357 RepID=A0ABR3JXZ9_9AGAR